MVYGYNNYCFEKHYFLESVYKSNIFEPIWLTIQSQMNIGEILTENISKPQMHHNKNS